MSADGEINRRLRFVRHILIKLFVISTISIICIVAIWKGFRANQRVKIALVERIESVTNDSLTIGALQLLPTSIQLRDIHFIKANKFHLLIDKCNINISVLNLLSNRGRWLESIDNINLDKPQIIIVESDIADSMNYEFLNYSKKMYPFLELNYPLLNIEISRGSIGKINLHKTIIQNIDASINNDNNSKLSIEANGDLTYLMGTKINVKGEIDLTAEELLFDVSINNEDMSNLIADSVNQDSTMLKYIDGWFQSRFEIRGRDDLVLFGNIVAHDVALKYGKLINIKVSEIKGELLGEELKLLGNVVMNGLKIPFRGAVSDIVKRNWQLIINEEHLNISDLRIPNFAENILTGTTDLKVEISGDKSGYRGRIASKSEEISIRSVPIRDIDFEVSITHGIAQIDYFIGSILGAELELGGFVNMSTGENRIDWLIDKFHYFDENLDWLGLDSNFVSMTGALSGVSGEVIGSGNCELLDFDGARLFAWNFDIDGYNIFGQFEGDDKETLGEIQFDFSQKPYSILVSGQNAHRIIKHFKNTKFVSDEFLKYEMNYMIEGNITNFDYKANLSSVDMDRLLSVNGNLILSGINKLITSGSLKFYLHSQDTSNSFDDGLILGEFDAVYRNNKLTINKFDLFSEVDTVLATVKAELDINNRDNDKIDIKLSDLPFPELTRFFYPDLFPNLFGSVKGSLLTEGSHSDYEFSCNFSSINIPSYDLKFSGKVDHDIFQIDDISLENKDNEIVFGLKAEINLSDMKLDTVITFADDLIIEHFIKAISGNDSSNYGGRFNMLANLSGDITSPYIEMNAHIASAYYHTMSGIWANIHLISEDSTYFLQNTDIGLDLKKIAEVEGQYIRDSKKYEINLVSAEHDVNDFVQLATGIPNIISGNANILIKMNNLESSPMLSGKINVRSGKIGKMGFDDLSTNFSVKNIGSSFASISIDTFGINWGDFTGNLNGNIPLNPNDSLALNGKLNGNLMAFLPRVSPFFTKSRSNGNFKFTGGGTIKNPIIEKADLQVFDGSIEMKDIVRDVNTLELNISLDSSGAIKVLKFSGKIEDKPFHLSNIFPESKLINSNYSLSGNKPNRFKQSIVIGNYNLGIIQFETGEDGIWTRIPGLMEREWGGYVIFSGLDGRGPFEFSGPASKPIGSGKIKLRKATFTYPFIKLKKGRELKRFPKVVLALLRRMEWDGKVVPEWGCKYVNEISGLRGMPFYDDMQKNFSLPLFDLDLKLYLDLDPSQDGLRFFGSVSDSFRIAGEISSTQGSIEYLDMKFNTKSIQAEFNQAELNPLFYGSAITTIIDSTGVPHEIRLVTRRNTGEGAGGFTINQDAPARWDDLNVLFEDDQNNSQEQILALLGYAPKTLDEKLPGLGGSLVERAIPIEKFTRRLERQLERWLNVDRIDINPTLTQNIIQQQISSVVKDNRYITQHGSYLQVFDQSSLTLGKYITRDIYLSYTGLIQSGPDKYNFTRLGMLHNWDALFRLWQIAPNLNFNYRYQYDSIAELSDHSFHIRLNFSFDL